MSKKIKQLQKKITPILKKNDVVRASVFGSFARGEDKKGSDIDMLVEFKEPKGMFHRIGLKYALEKILEKKVDLLTYNAINPLLKEYIYKDAIKIYEKRPQSIFKAYSK